MPRPVPPSLGEGLPDPNQQTDNVAPPPLVPEDVLRVLGGVGLPGDVEVTRFGDDLPSTETVVVPIFGAEEEPAAIIYNAAEGVNTAQERRGWISGADKALEILRQTERAPETDELYDEIVLSEAKDRIGWISGAEKVLEYLDAHRLRTEAAQAAANDLYDETILVEATSRRGWIDGSTKALGYLDSKPVRNPSTQEKADTLYDQIIIAEATARIDWVNGKAKALYYLDQHKPRTDQGAQELDALRKRIAGI